MFITQKKKNKMCEGPPVNNNMKNMTDSMYLC